MTGVPPSQRYAGVIPCERVFFTRFLWASPFDRFPYFAEAMFVECLFEASSRRPMRAGHKGLFLEAARLFVAVCTKSSKAFFTEYDGITDWSERELEALAVEIAAHYADDHFAVQRETKTALRVLRNQIYRREDPQTNEVVICDGETKIRGSVSIVFDETMLNSNELPQDTFNRTLDYIEHLKGLDGY